MTTPAGSTDDEYGGVRDSVGAVVDEAVSSGRIVGAVVLVSQKGNVVYRGAAGFANCRMGGNRLSPLGTC
jgi:hypothetical protein